MKLANKYNVHQCKLMENDIYTSIQGIFHRVFCDTPDMDMCASDISKDGFRYIEKNEEERFYKQYYTNLFSDQKYTRALNGSLISLNKYEYDLIDYVIGFKDKLLVLTGEKGWGKSTLIKYVFFHLLSQYNTNILPIYISFNKLITEFDYTEYDRFKTPFYKCLLDRIRHYTKSYLSDYKSDFWQYIKTFPVHSDFATQCTLLDQLEISNIITSNEKIDRFSTLVSKELLLNETIFDSLRYIAEKGKIRPIIIFDDLDPLSYDFLKYLFSESYSISHNYPFQVILAFRPSTYQHIKRVATFDAINPLEMEMRAPDCDSYLSNSLDKLKKELSSSNDITIQISNKELLPNDIKTFIDKYCKVILSKDARDFLASVSGNDLRVYKKLIRIYFSSGFIDPAKQIGFISDKSGDDSIPLWIVYSSIITNNHKTVFPHTKKSAGDYIINILCNGSQHANTYLIRLHILSFFSRHNRVQNIEKFISLYEKVVGNRYFDIESSIFRVFKRFNNSGVITNDKSVWIERKEEVKAIDEFYMKPLGHYYIDELWLKFEYLSYMKDDIDFTEIDDIKDCVLVLDKKDRFKELVKYITFFANEEINFIKQLNDNSKSLYLQFFAPVSEVKLFSLCMTNKMIEYGSRRQYDTYILDDLKQKLQEIQINHLSK